ncbi:hypothetical protein [Pseudomonas sp. PA-1-3F]|uniref:hypothetical protein n=1 Tax=Pseudomonas sp. PA-1-3F TaxID=2665465 RepID=UPI001F30D828|nr:hypothetical protein [Pseudomonas sp. PA-1-3F]
MIQDVKPHYKLQIINSNFVLKFLFNSLPKKLADRVSLTKEGINARRRKQQPWQGLQMR